MQLKFEITNYLDLFGKGCQVISTRKPFNHKHFEKYKHECFIYKENQIIYASKSSIVGIPSKFRIAAIKPSYCINIPKQSSSSIFELTDM